MADIGHELTDKLLKKLEKKIAAEYAVAVRDMEGKLQAYLEEDEAKRKVQEALLDAGKISRQDYQDWCFRHEMMGKRWKDMLDTLSNDMHHANEIALGMAKNAMPDVYALNHNFGLYEIEQGGKINTGLSLYNHDAAEYALRQQRQMMPGPSTKKAAEIAANKDLQWNKQKIQSAVLQGVLQGESPYQVAKRLMSVGQMNYNAAVRYARTMTTSTQNAGRYDSFRRATKKGVDLTIEWQATLDGRTRHEHRLMHGQRREVDEPFITPEGFKIMYPADSSGSSDAPQKEIWNCRCTLLAWVKGFEGQTVKESPGMGDMSFEEWQNAKPEKRTSDFTSGTSNGKMRSGSRQQREKRERTENSPIAKNPKEDPAVVSQLKPIAGRHSILSDMKAVNPNYDQFSFEWGENCTHCVTAYAARRRGFDVTALPRLADDKYAVGNGYTIPYQKGDRKPTRTWLHDGYTVSNFREYTKEQNRTAVESMMREYGDGSMAVISVFWDTDVGRISEGHVFIAENVKGKIHFRDPQNCLMDCKEYFDVVSPKSTDVFRIDDLPFNSEIGGVFRNDII